MRRLAARGALNTGPVILRWRERADGAVAYDPNLAVTKEDAAFTAKSDVVIAFIHYVAVGTTSFVRFSEVTAGDVILDFPGDVTVDGGKQLDALEGLQFEIDGKPYVQKKAGDALAKSWDLRCNGVAITRTILITPKE